MRFSEEFIVTLRKRLKHMGPLNDRCWKGMRESASVQGPLPETPNMQSCVVKMDTVGYLVGKDESCH